MTNTKHPVDGSAPPALSRVDPLHPLEPLVLLTALLVALVMFALSMLLGR